MKLLICLFLLAMPAVASAAETAAIESAPVLSQTEKSIFQFLDDWALAWHNQALNAYLGFYAKDFTPENGLSLAQWRAQRQQRLLAANFVQIQMIAPQITRLHGENATVQFVQKYRSNQLQDQTLKTLQLIREQGRWKILRESTAPIS
ncbi:hypothetical protein HQ393_15600 [Chitinibacter bivalviorum]|uniref:Cds6 C-terminal domain-containing protein n=1 Tax=Chitinibacter bivalviorum TaxID=2739434 RepID=A0A7H9BLK1_9NEIS|nr:hypothetical protein [Chitinibacter bivalviorum]QLG89557.1 hypothetical protein HQ393_15600 [Chitinibacter bivalviorum]